MTLIERSLLKTYEYVVVLDDKTGLEVEGMAFYKDNNVIDIGEHCYVKLDANVYASGMIVDIL